MLLEADIAPAYNPECEKGGYALHGSTLNRPCPLQLTTQSVRGEYALHGSKPNRTSPPPRPVLSRSLRSVSHKAYRSSGPCPHLRGAVGLANRPSDSASLAFMRPMSRKDKVMNLRHLRRCHGLNRKNKQGSRLARRNDVFVEAQTHLSAVSVSSLWTL